MRSLGFGLEYIGLAVLRAPKLASIAALTICLIVGVLLPRLVFDGNVISVLSERAPAYKTFSETRANFREFLDDVLIVVQVPDLDSAADLEDLRTFHLDLELEDPVASVMSMFSFSRADNDAVKLVPRLPGEFASDSQAAAAITKLLIDEPNASAFIARDKNTVAILVGIRKASELDGADPFDALKAAIEELAPERFKASYAGLPPLQAEIRDAILSDQIKLTIFGLILGTVVAYLVFGSLVSALICTMPALVATLWVLGLFAIFGIEINYLLTVLPTLAMVLAFADSIVLYFHWKRSLAIADDALKSLLEAVVAVGPASAMTSITTALAFISFTFSDSEALKDFGWLGALSVMMAFLAFITILPLTCYWSRLLSIGRVGAKTPALTRLGPHVGSKLLAAPWQLATIGVVLVLLLAIAHNNVGSQYRITAYLPGVSPVHEEEKKASENFGGSGRLFAVLDIADGENFHDKAVRDRLASVHEILAGILGADRVGSLHGVWKDVSEANVAAFAEEIGGNDAPMLRNVLSGDKRQLLVTAGIDALQPGSAVGEMIDKIRRDLDAKGLADRVTLTGFPLLASLEMPKLIESLRTGMLIAVLLAIGVIAVASGSLVLGLACLIPNLIPILSVEAVLWAIGHDHDTTTVIALTIAFGIAIDNAIHVINFYRRSDLANTDPVAGLRHALQDVAPALVASTAILCVALVITQFSAMPSINLLGRLMIVTLLIALVSNILFLPSYIRVLTSAAKRLFRR